ncbi:MAG: hypothetical protein WDN72_06760 [Alphaproteobacteria bacterium]
MVLRFLFHTIFMPVRIAIRLFLLPFRILQHHMIWVILIIGGFLLWHAMANHHSQPSAPAFDNTLPAAPQTASPGAEAPPAPPGVDVSPELRSTRPGVRIDPVVKLENGDSEFSHDLYAAMTPIEKSYYSRVFYDAMNTMTDNEPYNWAQGNIQGTLMPVETFNNKMGNRCRTFSEVLKVHTVEQRLTGFACEDGAGSWCKLKPTATPVCGLGGYHPGIMDSLKRLF